MLELNRLTGQVAEMAEALAGQQTRLQSLTEQARQKLAQHAQVTDELKEKLGRATEVDSSWRGAEPLSTHLDAITSLPAGSEPATLIASDGSQIYPDPHAIALYFLLNVGAIVLRQGSGAAPATWTRSRVYFDERDLYDQAERLIETDQVNARRDLWELRLLAELVTEERRALAGDMDRLLVAVGDGPLLLWMPQRLSDTQQARRVEEFGRELDALRRMQAAPLGYVDRPRSANVLRLLQLADIPLDQITTQRLRANPYRGLSDRLLFGNLLGPGQRTGWFAATSEINKTYANQGHRICFCYLNTAVEESAEKSRIVRIEAPEWLIGDEDLTGAALAAVWADSRLTGYPYVLARAHELAVVSHHERGAFEQMLRVELMRRQMTAEVSPKQQQKSFTGRSR
ncbi:MAG: DNA double-strand break repair nuclease NurA [Caldilineales bacterium]